MTQHCDMLMHLWAACGGRSQVSDEMVGRAIAGLVANAGGDEDALVDGAAAVIFGLWGENGEDLEAITARIRDGIRIGRAGLRQEDDKNETNLREVLQ